MMENIILWASMGWLPILIGLMLANEAKFKKNIVIGVTLPYEAREDAEVKDTLVKFKRTMFAVCAVLEAVTFGLFLIHGEGAMMTAWMIWVDAAIILPNVPYVFANLHLHELKEKKGWSHPAEERIVSVNTDAIPATTWISPWVFAPSGIFCLLMILWDREMAWMYVMFAAICAFFWFGYRYLYRNKSEMVDENTDLTIALSRIRKYNWGKMWIISSYAMAVYALTVSLMQYFAALSLILMMAATAVLCFYAFKIEFTTRRLQEKLTRDSGQQWYADEDDHWIWGMFYYNKDDSRLIINNRIGINTTINLAKASGKVLYALVALMLACMPFIGVWMNAMSSQPILMRTDAEVFTVQSGSTTYTVQLNNIKEATLLAELPDHLSRKMGTGMEHYLEGKFSADGIGNVTVLLDPTVSPYILIETQGGSYFLFGSREADTTETMYQELKNASASADAGDVSPQILVSACMAW